MSDETDKNAEPEELTSADLDKLAEDEPAAPEKPKVLSPAERVRAAERELVEAKRAVAALEGYEDDPDIEPGERTRRALQRASVEVDSAQRQLELAMAERNRASKEFSDVREANRNRPLHELNAHQRKITRVEDSRRQKAAEAVRELTRHQRPRGQDPHPGAVRAAQGNQG